MGGIHLEFFVHEGERHHGALMSDWLLGEAQRIGIAGGSAFRAVAGYGRHGVMHEQHFYELAGNLPVQIVFLTSRELAKRLLKRLADEKLKLVYSISETEYGVTGRD